MKPATHNLTVYRDRDFSQIFYLKSQGVAIDLTGFTGKAEIRSGKDADIVTVAFQVTIDHLNGCIELSLTDTQTILFVDDAAFWDLVLTDTHGKRQNYIEGTVKILGTVTRDEAGGMEMG
jgi:hypothetical protein